MGIVRFRFGIPSAAVGPLSLCVALRSCHPVFLSTDSPGTEALETVADTGRSISYWHWRHQLWDRLWHRLFHHLFSSCGFPGLAVRGRNVCTPLVQTIHETTGGNMKRFVPSILVLMLLFGLPQRAVAEFNIKDYQELKKELPERLTVWLNGYLSV